MFSHPTGGEASSKHSLAIVYAALGCILLAALAMRLWQARESLWLDELHTAWVVSGGWDEIPARAKAGNQPPLYFYLEAGAARLLGLGEATLRLPSIVAGVTVILLSFALVHRRTGAATAALAAAIVMAVDRDFFFYSTEARVYAIVQAAALFRLGVFVKMLTTPTAAWRAAYVGIAALMFHLHYTTALLWIGEAACVSIARRGGGRRSLSDAPATHEYRHEAGASLHSTASHLVVLSLPQFLLDSSLMLLLFLPAAQHAAEVFQRRENWESFVALPTFDALIEGHFAERASRFACYLAPPFLCILVAKAGKRPSTKEPAPSGLRILPLVALWIAAPVAAAWLLSITDVARLFFYRYLIASASAVPLLAGLLCAAAPTRAWRFAASALTIAAALWCTASEYVAQFSHDHRFLADRNEDWRSAVAYLNGNDARLPVLLYAGLIETRDYAGSPDPLLEAYCVLPVTGAYRLETTGPVIPLASLSAPRLSSENCRSILEARGAWVLLRVRQSDSAEALRQAERLVASCGRKSNVIDAKTFGGVTAARIEVR